MVGPKARSRASNASDREERRALDADRQLRKNIDTDYTLLPPRFVGQQSNQITHCQRILDELTANKTLVATMTSPFTKPVDDVALGLSDYYTIITHPIALSMMQQKLTHKQYASPDEFGADMRLVLANCFKCHAPDSTEHQLGRKLEEYFEKRWKWIDKRTEEFKVPKAPKAPEPHQAPTYTSAYSSVASSAIASPLHVRLFICTFGLIAIPHPPLKFRALLRHMLSCTTNHPLARPSCRLRAIAY